METFFSYMAVNVFFFLITQFRLFIENVVTNVIVIFPFMVFHAEIRDDKNRGHPSPGELDFLHEGGERHRPKCPLLPQIQLHQRGSHLLALQRWELSEQEFFILLL